MPTPETAAGGTYCEPGCHEIKPKYQMPKTSKRKTSALQHSEAAIHFK
jgi:hypothetical protein